MITVWGGTAFNCTGTNQISLLHIQYQLGNAIGVCNDGALVAYGIRKAENFFTSRLDVRLTAGLQGRTIVCSVVESDRNVTVLGTKTVIVSTPSGTFIMLTNNSIILSIKMLY